MCRRLPCIGSNTAVLEKADDRDFHNLFTNGDVNVVIKDAAMTKNKRRSGFDRRKGRDRRSGVDTRSKETKRLQGERRSDSDRRSGLDRRLNTAAIVSP